MNLVGPEIDNRPVLILTPGGLENGGGIGRLVGYMVEAWHRVPPGTWETLSFPSSTAAGDTAYQLPIDPRLRVRLWVCTMDATMVSPSEGNQARRNGRQGMQHLILPWHRRATRTPGQRGECLRASLARRVSMC